jgi:hypothetical protein
VLFQKQSSAITDRFAGLQARWLNVHMDFPLLQRMALPITTGSVYYAGIKIHETRIIRLLESDRASRGSDNATATTRKNAPS